MRGPPSAALNLARRHAGFDRLALGLERLCKGAASGVLTVTVSPAFTTKWLLPRFESFQRAWPEQRRTPLEQPTAFTRDACGHVFQRQRVFKGYDGDVVAVLCCETEQHAARQACLADAAGACQADQAHIIARDEFGNESPLSRAADKASQPAAGGGTIRALRVPPNSSCKA